jgi:energy-coupling factor transporter ATP-binding protein EcfA2
VSELLLERVWSAPLKDVSLRSSRGLSVVVGAEADGSGELVALCAGTRAPRRGRVTLGGLGPSSSPACRRGIASLLPVEPGGGDGDVRGWLLDLAPLIGIELSAVLAGLALAPDRALASLSGVERRELALAVALAHPEPALVVLHEPLTACAPGQGERVLARLAELGKERPVLVTTASIATARRFGGTTYWLDRGLCGEKPDGAWPGSMTPGLDTWLAVEADAPRGLVSALAQHPDVQELRYDERTGGRVLLRGPDLERLAVAVARAAVSAGVDIRLLRAAAEDLSAARGAASGAIDAADAYRAARARGRAATSATPRLATTDANRAAEPPERTP